MTAFMSHQVVDDRVMLPSVEDDVSRHGPRAIFTAAKESMSSFSTNFNGLPVAALHRSKWILQAR